MVIVSESHESVSVTVAPDHAKLGLSPDAPWKDLLADAPLEPGAPLEVRPGNYRLVQVGKPTGQ